MTSRLGSLWENNLSISQRLLRLPLRLIPSSAELPILGGINRGRKWIVGSNVRRCWLGTYERPMQLLIARRIRLGMAVWDIGANVGFHTLAFSNAVGLGGSVTAIEPQCQNVGFLQRHLELNHSGNVSVLQCGVSDRASICSFSVGRHSSEGRLEPSATSYKIPTVTLDDYAFSYDGGVPDLMKIDVEGAESAALKGAVKILEERGPEIWLALHGEEQRVECGCILEQRQYRFYDLSGERLKTIPAGADMVVCVAKSDA